MNSHEVDYKIGGHDVQYVEIELDPNETVIAEAGAMLYMKDGIDFQTKMGDGSEPIRDCLGNCYRQHREKLPANPFLLLILPTVEWERATWHLLLHTQEPLFRLN